MKKVLLLLTLILSINIMWAQLRSDVFAYAAPSGPTLYYKITGSNTVQVTWPYYDEDNDGYRWDGFSEPSGYLEIPSTITHNGTNYSVTSISQEAFWDCSGLECVIIPNTVTSIGSNAFSNTNARYIQIPSSVTSIGGHAFSSVKVIKDQSSATYASNNQYWGATYRNLPTSGNLMYTTNDYNGSRTTIIGCLPSATSVTIPSSVTTIGTKAFSGCPNLTEITIPSGVTSIGASILHYCSNLTTINYNATNATYSGSESISGNCPNLRNIVIGNNVTSIPAYLFYSYYSPNYFTHVTIGSGVTSIGNGAFYGVTNLTNVNYLGTVAGWCNIAFGNEYSNPLNYAHALSINGTPVTNLVIPEGVSQIKQYAFKNCQNLTSVTIPSTMTSIANNAFSGCTGLTSVIFNATNCTEASTISNNSNSLYTTPFPGCTGLQTLTVGGDVRRIPQGIFYGCSNLSTINLNSSNPPILENDAFVGVAANAVYYVPCGSIATYYETQWGGLNLHPAAGCNASCQITVSSADASMGTATGGGQHTEGDLVQISATPAAGYRFLKWSDGSRDNPRNVMASGDKEYVASFTDKPYFYCGFESTAANSQWTFVTRTGSNRWVTGTAAHYDGRSSLYVSNNGTTNVTSYFFSSVAVAYTPIAIPTTGEYTLSFDWRSSSSTDNASSGYMRVALVPSTVDLASCSDSYGGYFTSLPTGWIAMDGGRKRGSSNWLFNTHTEQLSGGSYYLVVLWGSNNSNSMPAAIDNIELVKGHNVYCIVNSMDNSASCDGFTTTNPANVGTTMETSRLDIPAQVYYQGRPVAVSTINTNAFDGCTTLTSLVIPTSITHIGTNAFRGCTALSNVEFNAVNCDAMGQVSQLGTVSDLVFSGCTGLQHVTIGENVTRIPDVAFAGLSSLTTLVFNATNCQTAGSTSYARSFKNCSNLSSVTIGDHVTTIPKLMFSYCSGLHNIDLPNSVTTIGEYAFEECGLQEIEMSNSLTTIETGAFARCTLPYFVVPGSVTSIGSSAFSGCTNLNTIYNYSNNATFSVGVASYGVTPQRVVLASDTTKTSLGVNALVRVNNITVPQNELPLNYIANNGNGWKARKVKLTDGQDAFNAPVTFTAAYASYTRDFTNGNRSTLYLPFNASAPNNFQVFEYSNFNGTTLTFSPKASNCTIEANHPYLVGYGLSKDVTKCTIFSHDAVFPATTPDAGAITQGNQTNGTMTFHGVTARTTMANGNYGYMNGYFVQSQGSSHLNPFRCYFTHAGSSSAPTTIDIDITDDGNVDIEIAEPEQQQHNARYSTDVYDMMGRMVRRNAETLQGLPRGIYIWKGKKVMVY